MNSRTWKTWSLLPHSLWQTVCIHCLTWESVCKSYNGLSMNYSIFLLPKVTKVLSVTMNHCCTLEQSTCVSMAECSLITEGDLFSTQRIKKKKFWPHPTAYETLVPWPGLEPMLPALEGRVLNTGPPGKTPLPRILQLFYECQQIWLTAVCWWDCLGIVCFSLFSYCFGFDVKTFSQLLFREIPFHDLHNFQPAHIISLH